MYVVVMQGMGPKRPSSGSMSARATANAMLEAKNTRKRAEADVHLLANRLAHLQAEEDKARRKTEETKQVFFPGFLDLSASYCVVYVA